MKKETDEIIFDNKYKIIKKLGEGGMGSVYLAFDLTKEKNVALKTLVLDSSLDQINRDLSIHYFKREARAISKLHHTNIVNLYGFGQEDENTHYIVMELIDGQPVSKILELHPFSMEIVLSIAIQIGDALAYIHRNGVIHRDVKTENIMLLGKGLAKLTDFGISKFSSDYEVIDENNDSIMGTILYMSPEQLNSPDNVDPRSDLYSFAATLYEMLTGRLPLESDNINKAIMKVLKEIPLPPSTYNPTIPKSFDKLILKALEKEKEARHDNIDAFIEELRNIPEYKHFIEIKELQFARDFGAIKTILNKVDIKEAIRKAQDVVNNLSKILDEEENNSNFGNVDLSWIDNLDFLVEEANKLKDEKSNVIESLFYVIPTINSEKVKNLALNSKNFKDTKALLDFLNIFDGAKSLRQVIEINANANVFDTFIESSSKNILPDEVLHAVNSLNLVVSHQPEMKTLLEVLKYSEKPNDLLDFLSNIKDYKNLRKIIDENYSIKKISYVFDLLHLFCEKNIISLKILEPEENLDILIGDMLVKFANITRAELSYAIKEKDKLSNKNKQIGEILVQLGFITKENFMNILKIQLWYKGFFNKK
ncbi:MAG: serine/threonine-protein kinase [Cyanobacteriota bacterium]